MLSIRNFSKKYSDRLILSIPEMNFGEGVHWIKGENGSGKSTLFRAISGMIPFQGTITFDDGIGLASNRKKYLQRVTYAEAEPVYPDFVTARDLLSFVGKARNAPKQEQESLAALLGVSEYQNEPVQSYSSGMLKKVSLTLSFLGSPKLIVLDEPLITLDSDSIRTLLSMIREKSEKLSTTFLISSHQQLSTHDIHLKDTFAISNRTLVRENQIIETA